MKVMDVGCLHCGEMTEDSLVSSHLVTEKEYDFPDEFICKTCKRSLFVCLMPAPAFNMKEGKEGNKARVKEMMEAKRLERLLQKKKAPPPEERAKIQNEINKIQIPKNKRGES